ncbi:hypothetical protein B0H10DRAFT_2196199 [Mycena sp. CBHHK59/15]|nr:hypothetical protein B0H10DRAFT_2196199 [Mycena sp. CBHHK59/15]
MFDGAMCDGNSRTTFMDKDCKGGEELVKNSRNLSVLMSKLEMQRATRTKTFETRVPGGRCGRGAGRVVEVEPVEQALFEIRSSVQQRSTVNDFEKQCSDPMSILPHRVADVWIKLVVEREGMKVNADGGPQSRVERVMSLHELHALSNTMGAEDLAGSGKCRRQWMNIICRMKFSEADAQWGRKWNSMGGVEFDMEHYRRLSASCITRATRECIQRRPAIMKRHSHPARTCIVTGKAGRRNYREYDNACWIQGGRVSSGRDEWQEQGVSADKWTSGPLIADCRHRLFLPALMSPSPLLLHAHASLLLLQNFPWKRNVPHFIKLFEPYPAPDSLQLKEALSNDPSPILNPLIIHQTRYLRSTLARIRVGGLKTHARLRNSALGQTDDSGQWRGSNPRQDTMSLPAPALPGIGRIHSTSITVSPPSYLRLEKVDLKWELKPLV